jgi:hypothetical protein
MTIPTQPSDESIESETVVFHKADGTPTTNADEAATAEITTRYKDGSVKHTVGAVNG